MKDEQKLRITNDELRINSFKSAIRNCQFVIRNSKKGFTLLELLVVIGIISIMLSMGFVSYSSAQKKTRDTKIKTDLKSIQDAFEQYYSICGYQYPVPVSGHVPTSIVCTDTNPDSTIMATVPKEPKGGKDYTMTQTSVGADYQICSPNTPAFESETTDPYCLNNLQ